MVPISRIPAIVEDTILEWRNTNAATCFSPIATGDPAVGRADRAVAGHALRRALTRRRPGARRWHCRPCSTGAAATGPSLVRHGALLLFLAGLPVLHARARRSVHVADPRRSVVSRPPHRADDRRVVQHDGAVPGRAPQAKAPNEATFFTTVAAAETFIRQRMNGKYRDLIALDRVRRRSLRRHAVHERLRQHPAQPLAHRRPDRVHEVSRSGDDHRRRRSSRASVCSRRSISSTPPAT